MDCQLIRGELVAYHFGSVEERTRDLVEAHLVECPDCLKGYLALKREIETAQAGPVPSQSARDRLRRAVAQEVSQRAREAAQPGWWRRPLAFGFAAASAAAVMLMVVSVREQLHQMARLTEETSLVQPPPGPLQRSWRGGSPEPSMTR
ncbi:MAG TPA: zf-HC2 domain-containing protein [Myxococcales bacterium]|jgi:anti-sigma factor RsiW